ncbi:MAG TPA: hypothetical protein VJ011_05345 [Steroidobacteraceae bacterium]|nr:hypothetical protein [Steroidobacteraceae bacterium]
MADQLAGQPMRTSTQLMLLIHAFVALRAKLVRAFTQIHPTVQDWHLFSDCPETGNLIVDGVLWTFHKPGSGLTFRSPSGVTLDLHRALPDPRVFDVWRLLQYVASVQSPSETPPTESELQAQLEELARAGYVVRMDPGGGFRLRG